MSKLVIFAMFVLVAVVVADTPVNAPGPVTCTAEMLKQNDTTNEREFMEGYKNKPAHHIHLHRVHHEHPQGNENMAHPHPPPTDEMRKCFSQFKFHHFMMQNFTLTPKHRNLANSLRWLLHPSSEVEGFKKQVQTFGDALCVPDVNQEAVRDIEAAFNVFKQVKPNALVDLESSKKKGDFSAVASEGFCKKDGDRFCYQKFASEPNRFTSYGNYANLETHHCMLRQNFAMAKDALSKDGFKSICDEAMATGFRKLADHISTNFLLCHRHPHDHKDNVAARQ